MKRDFTFNSTMRAEMGNELTTIVRSIDPAEPSAADIDFAASVIRSGGLVAFPTETVYGLGANALDPAAAARIFAAKGRPANNPLILHVADAPAARALVAGWPPEAEKLAQSFWPGPLTIVLRRGAIVPDIVAAGGPTVAVRVPVHAVAQALIRKSGVPLAAPSANRSSELSPTRPEHVLKGLGGRIDCLLDGGPTPGGMESTVIDLSSAPARLLRLGPIPPRELEAILGPVALLTRASTPAPLPSPGMLSRHYAPRTPLELSAGRVDALKRLRDLIGSGLQVGYLPLGPIDVTLPRGVVVRPMPAESPAYEALLYAVLHEMDALALDRLLVEEPPEREEWLAVRDRLRRASS
jgi:L-threonylcarbamoyladenylate synthase